MPLTDDGLFTTSSELREPLAPPVGRRLPSERFGHADALTPEARCEERDALALAYIAALQYLPSRQRAVLVLREVLAYSARDIAQLLATSVPSVNSALQRARKTVKERIPAESQFTSRRYIGDEHMRGLVVRFVEAFEAGDVNGIMSVLAKDAPIARSA